MTDQENDQENRAEEFLQVFKKGAEFTTDLLKENERLRYQNVQVEEQLKILNESAGEGGASEELLKKIQKLEEEKVEIVSRIKHVEEENIDFANRYVEIENENNMLANLYIATYQLHSTLDFKEVTDVILEIVINLIGAEEFSILLLDEKTTKLEAVASEGLKNSEIPSFELGEGIVG
jgi:hypothetical protein